MEKGDGVEKHGKTKRLKSSPQSEFTLNMETVTYFIEVSCIVVLVNTILIPSDNFGSSSFQCAKCCIFVAPVCASVPNLDQFGSTLS